VILVDTSVWVDHLRRGDANLASLLNRGQVMTHPFVIGELALGHLKPRESILRALADLPQTSVAAEPEVLHFIDRHALFGTGISYIDAHLLAAAKLTAGVSIWTRDKHLSLVADRLELAASASQSEA
jgi:predicted nucleic acid-binding protein